MTTKSLRVVRRAEQLLSDDRRVILRYLDFVHPPRIRSIARRVLRIPEREVRGKLAKIKRRFATRHRDLEAAFHDNGVEVLQHLRDTRTITEVRKLLVGAYFTMEYSIEAAALFNPSIVPHPDQGDLPAGSVRFLMSLRATGEGHVSSIVFRRGVIDRAGRIRFDPPPRFAYTARPVPDRALAKDPFLGKLRDHGLSDAPASKVLAELPDPFTIPQLRGVLGSLQRSGGIGAGLKRLPQTMLWMALANYELCFPEDCLPSETVIFPATPYEARGMEDVRMVRFEDDDGTVCYYGTYTAFDGFRIYPMLLETRDFRTFRITTLSGRHARNKGMALFPRKIDGHYGMLSRHDGENLHLLRSRDLHVWNASTRLQTPREHWELVQVGNCGSPLETDAGWLVLTHGVGPLRQYCIGALLLDLQEPTRVLGRLREPLLVPTAAEREGYVPNVVYSCGSMIHHGRVIVPYAMSDSRTSFATVSLKALLHRLLEAGPDKREGR
jgi:predicted GH43/DUF377 family glycosyl hydrolase